MNSINSKYIICIDAGHGGYDSGAVNNKRYEKDDNLKMALILEKELLKYGFTVIQTRLTDKHISLNERSNLANKSNSDVFISLHRNAFINSSACGVENWIYEKADEKTKQFATFIYEEILKTNVQKNRGVKKGNFHVLRETKMPAFLLELGFISNNKDNELFDKYCEQYAKAIVKGIINYFNLNYSNFKPNIDINEKHIPLKQELYKVQVGAFKEKENALKLIKELEQKGYKAFLI